MSVIMGVIAVNVYNVLSNTIDGTKRIAASIKKINLLQATGNCIANAEASVRGYLISKQTDYLDPYYDAVDKINGSLNPSALFKIMPEHVTQIGELNDYTKKEFLYLNSLLLSSQQNNQPPKKNITIPFEESNYAMNNIRIIINNLSSAENAKLDALRQQQEQGINNVIVILFSGLFLFLVLLLTFYVMVSKNFAMRNRVEKDLFMAKQYAEETSNNKTQFLATVSHGIRSPLNRVVGNTSLLNQTTLNQEQKKYAQNIQRSSITLLSIVNDILDFSKIESGALILENLPFVLSHCIEEVFSLTGSADKEIKMSYSIDPALPVLIVGDMGRLWQVLINILGNTIDSFSQGFITLDAELQQSSESEVVIRFVVTGTGSQSDKNQSSIGNKEALQTNKQHSSTGLGLSITSRLIALMGGTLKVTTQGDKTIITSFTIKTKPILEQKERNDFARDIATEKLDVNMSQKMPLHILVADDNEMSQVLLSSILLTMGYACDIATNGEEALAMAIEEEYDLIFMDIFMPQMDGIEAAEKIRKYYMNKEFPIIVAVTANILFTEKEKCFAAGMNDFLTKPFNPKILQNLIIKWANIKDMLEV